MPRVKEESYNLRGVPEVLKKSNSLARPGFFREKQKAYGKKR